jgi:hypothetical protein
LVPAIHPVITLSRHVLVLLEAEVTGLRNAHALRAAVTNIAGKNRVLYFAQSCQSCRGPSHGNDRPGLRRKTRHGDS